MSSPRVNICSGYPLESPKGNSVTAKRLQELLNQSGYDATAMHSATPPAADHLIALHAIKTADTIRYFHQRYPQSKIHVILTGTDLYRDIHQRQALAEHIFTIADSLVLAHEAAFDTLPKKWHHKATVIHPSISLIPPTEISSPALPLFTTIGHLRPVKNSHLMAKALTLIPDLPLAAYSIGDSLTEEEAAEARFHQQNDQRYRWIPGQNRADALGWINASIATLNTSHIEGGSNAIIEAMHLECPVLASNVEGNRGLLGKDYAGLFEPNNAQALADLITRCLNDTTFLPQLRQQISERRPQFTPQVEQSSWHKLLTKVASK